MKHIEKEAQCYCISQSGRSSSSKDSKSVSHWGKGKHGQHIDKGHRWTYIKETHEGWLDSTLVERIVCIPHCWRGVFKRRSYVGNPPNKLNHVGCHSMHKRAQVHVRSYHVCMWNTRTNVCSNIWEHTYHKKVQCMWYPSKLIYKVPNIWRGRSVSTIAEFQVDTFWESYTPTGILQGKYLAQNQTK